MKEKQNFLNKIKVRSNGEGPIPTYVTINGRPLNGVRAIDYHIDTDSIPEFTFSINGIKEIKANNAITRFEITPNSVIEAAELIRHELLKRGDIYDSFAASIESSVREQGLQLPFQPTREVAEKILDRVIGVESNV